MVNWTERSLCALIVFTGILVAGTCFAADSATAPVAADAAKPAASATPPTPELPAYFSGANADKTKPTWPDPTGGAAGTWATPAGDGKADIPSKLTNTDLYDRIAHNLFSINMVWVLIAGFLVMFMQTGFAMVETGLCRAKNAAHTMSMNFHGIPVGLSRILGVRIRDRLGQLVQRTCCAGLVFITGTGHVGAQ